MTTSVPHACDQKATPAQTKKTRLLELLQMSSTHDASSSAGSGSLLSLSKYSTSGWPMRRSMRTASSLRPLARSQRGDSTTKRESRVSRMAPGATTPTPNMYRHPPSISQ